MIISPGSFLILFPHSFDYQWILILNFESSLTQRAIHDKVWLFCLYVILHFETARSISDIFITPNIMSERCSLFSLLWYYINGKLKLVVMKYFESLCKTGGLLTATIQAVVNHNNCYSILSTLNITHEYIMINDCT